MSIYRSWQPLSAFKKQRLTTKIGAVYGGRFMLSHWVDFLPDHIHSRHTAINMYPQHDLLAPAAHGWPIIPGGGHVCLYVCKSSVHTSSNSNKHNAWDRSSGGSSYIVHTFRHIHTITFVQSRSYNHVQHHTCTNEHTRLCYKS